MLVQELTLKYIGSNLNKKEIKQYVWAQVKEAFSQYYFHPETLYNCVTYRYDLVLKEYDQRPQEFIVFENMD